MTSTPPPREPPTRHRRRQAKPQRRPELPDLSSAPRGVVSPVRLAHPHREHPNGARGDGRAGLCENLNRVIGVVLLVCLILYLVPATSILGAVLLTGYLGGAVATNMLTEQPIISTTLFPIYVGIFVWGGLFLRDARVRSIVPVRRA